MMRVLFWKEYREHRSIWLAMLVLSAMILFALFELLDPPGEISSHSQKPEFIAGVAMALSAIYGLVCGSIMLAGERESGSIGFLDSLSASRSSVWWVKLIAGGSLTLAQALGVGGLAFALGGGLFPLPFPLPHLAWLGILVTYCLGAFAWGMLGSSLWRSVVLAAVAGLILSVVLTTLIAIVEMFLLSLVISSSVMEKNDFLGILVAAVPAFLALASSGVIFCWVDLDRRASQVRQVGTGQTIKWFPSWRVLLWLAFRQGWMVLLVLVIVGFILGLMVPFNEMAMLIWPAVTMVIGVLCGIGVFAGEQASGSFRFLGAQRFPPGRIWLVKSSWWMVMAAVAVLFSLAAFYLRLVLTSDSERHQWHEALKRIQEVRPLVPTGLYVTFWLIGGFCVGQFFSLVWRRSIVAVVVSLFVAAPACVVWFPSMVAGGLHAWQVLCFPIILLATTRISMWAWMAGRLYSPRPAALLAGGGLLALACLVGGLWYRLVEIPDVGEPFDVKAFAAGISGPEPNESRQAIQEALQESQERQIEADSQAPPPKPIRLPQDAQAAPAKPDGDAARPAEPPDVVVEEAQIPVRNYYELIEHVLDGLVPASDPQVGKWLDLVFQGDWMKHLSEAVQLPLAVFTDPRTANLASDGKIEHSASQTARAILARALQLQSQKKNAEALDHIKTVLALSRHLRHKAGTYYYLSGLTIEKLAIEALNQWVHDLGDQPQLLRRAIDELTRHAAAVPPNDSLKADYLITLNNLNIIDFRYAFVTPDIARGKERPVILDVLESAWLMPWEKNRVDRLSNLLFSGWMRGVEAEYSQLREQQFDPNQKRESHAWLALKNWLPPQTGRAAFWTREKLCDFIDQSVLRNFGFLRYGPVNVRVYSYLREAVLQGTRLQLALMLYEYEEKKPAPSLEALVPRYLPELPKDPFSGQSFHYRVSAGELISQTYNTEPIRVPAGQGILWSVGLDGQDNGGTKQGVPSSSMDPSVWNRGELDLIFLVPQWSPAKK